MDPAYIDHHPNEARNYRGEQQHVAAYSALSIICRMTYTPSPYLIALKHDVILEHPGFSPSKLVAPEWDP